MEEGLDEKKQLDDSRTAPPPTPTYRLSERNCEELLSKMIKLGYFHTNVAVRSTSDGISDDDIVDSIKAMHRTHRRLYSATDENCELMFTSSSAPDRAAVTLSRLVSELDTELASSGGRMAIPEAASTLMVDIAHIDRAALALCATPSTLNGTVQRVGLELLSSKYLDGLAEEVNAKLESDGRVLVSELAGTVFQLPMDVTVHAIEDMMSRGLIRNEASLKGGTSNEILTRAYQEALISKIRESLRGVTLPTPLDAFAKEFGWDAAATFEHVRTMCSDGTLPGEICSDMISSSLSGAPAKVPLVVSGAIYVPAIYATMQRKNVDDFFSSNAFITSDKCLSMGVSKSRMGQYVKKSFPNAVILSNAVINPDVIVNQLEAAVLESIASDSFVDLRSHFPDALLSNEEDLRHMICNMVLPNIHASIGGKTGTESQSLKRRKPDDMSRAVMVISDRESLFFSPGMVGHVEAEVLPALIEEYGKARAEEIDRTEIGAVSKKNKQSQKDVDEIFCGGKMKRGGTKRGGRNCRQLVDDTEGKGFVGESGTSKKPTKSNRKVSASSSAKSKSNQVLPRASVLDDSVVPLSLVAKKVGEAYPGLLDVQENYGCVAKVDEEGSPTWEKSDESLDGGGPLYEFCRVALYTDGFRRSCARAVKAELDRIVATKHGASVGQKDGATKVFNIETAFEHPACYPAACHFVHMFAKLSQFAFTNGSEAELVALLEHDFLVGCGANFAQRITEYCLYKYGIEGIFCFRASDSATETGLPRFCQPIDPGICSFDKVYLSCTPAENGKERYPLPTLREVLPGNAGMALARMWSLCGEECYAGGGKISDNGDFTHPGDLNGFLSHVEEACLTICGIPFSKANKKTEKQAMSARRKSLTQALEATTEDKDVLELTVALLFQQVKNIAASGSCLSWEVLELLSKEKKIPIPVSDKLRMLAICVKSGEDADDDTVNFVRECGLCRDISKYNNEK